MSVTVIDASALSAVMFDEPGSEPPPTLLSTPLVAPTLLRYELAQVCLGKLQRQPADNSVIRSQYALFERFAVDLREPDWAALPDLAARWKLSGYDAAYLQLALALEAPLITLDVRLLRAWRDAIA